MTVKVYALVLFALATAMFSRILTAVGAPSFLDFAHFPVVAVAFVLLCSTMRPHLVKFQVGLCVFLTVIVASALVNGAGIINVFLDFLLLAEPFLLLLAIVSVPWSRSSVERFRYWLLLFVGVHVALAFFQTFVLGAQNDEVQGVFLGMGAGHHVAGAVALSAALYILYYFPSRSTWLRVIIAALSAGVVILSDAKQVLVVFLLSLVILGVTKWKHAGAVSRYLAISVAAAGLILWMAATVFPELNQWADTDRIQTGLEQKVTVFPLIASSYDSSLNVLLGLGPGHTVGRLGLLLPDYLQYLGPLGATTSPVTEAVYWAQQMNYVSNPQTGSSMWSLQFSWAGVWGDLGVVGVATYLFLWWMVWRNLCLDDVSRFFLINILVFGLVFTWMEEPPYMLFVASLIGIQWQVRKYAPARVARKGLIPPSRPTPRPNGGRPVPLSSSSEARVGGRLP